MSDEIQRLREARPDAAGPRDEVVESARAALMADVARGRPSRRWGRRRIFGLAAPALTAAVVAAVLATTLTGPNDQPARAAELARVAEAAPRLLISAPGWKVQQTGRLSIEYGQVTLSDGERKLEVQWLPAAEYQIETEKRAAELEDLGTAPAADGDARLFRYPGTDEYVAIWLRGDYTVEARGRAFDAEAFKVRIAALREVDITTWISAVRESRGGPAEAPRDTSKESRVVPAMSEMSVFSRPRTAADVLPESMHYLVEPRPCPKDLRDRNRCSSEDVAVESRLLLSDLGAGRQRLYSWPSFNGGACFAPSGGGGVCAPNFNRSIRAMYLGIDPGDKQGRGGSPGAIMGIVPDDVATVDVVVLGMRRPATFGNNGFFYELPDDACGMATFDKLIVTFRDGSTDSESLDYWVNAPRHEGKAAPAFCRD